MTDHLPHLIDRLSPTCRTATLQAANLCVIRQHATVDLDHLWASVLDRPSSDAADALGRAGDMVAVRRELDESLARDRARGEGTPVFAPALSSLLGRAAAQVPTDSKIGSGHLLLGMLSGDAWLPEVHALSPTWAAIPPKTLADALANRPSAELVGYPVPEGRADRDSALSRFTVDLTARARMGRVDPVVGRERETLQLIDVLGRRRQNNPILVGDAGVGKTAVVEGLALAIADGKVPGSLAGTRLLVLDLGLLQAGASVKGEFESRLRDLLADVAASPQPIVMFVDEAHTMIGAGGAAGQNDAANLLKPALARGELRTIGATTWAEYKKYFEKDAALARRFQPVEVKEPEPAIAEAMLRALVPALEAHAGVRILDEAVRAAVQLSARYLRDRQLPDKAVSLLDTATSRVALSRLTPHPQLAALEGELERAREEHRAQARDVMELGDCKHAAAMQQGDIQALETRLALQRKAIANELASLDASAGPEATSGELPMVPRYVDARVIADVLADWTGIPVGRLQEDEVSALSELQERLSRRVSGQDHALKAIAECVRSARSGLGDPRRPNGVFLLVGPSGVGKTETALALAEALLGDERHVITLNMSEFQEPHSVSALKGAPAGYVGYGEGGTLTESVRRHPYGVLLLDEVEKAHADVRELFYQVFDRGYMTDAEGRDIDFRHLTILLTSNVGSAIAMRACLNGRLVDRPTPEHLLEDMRPALYQAFAPAFLGRTHIVPYYPLADEVMDQVLRRRLRTIAGRVQAQYGAVLTFGSAVVDWAIERCNEADAGARAPLRLVDGPILTAITNAVLARPSLNHTDLGLGCLAGEPVCTWAPPAKAAR
jgi:type VI secretion system protein VasG